MLLGNHSRVSTSMPIARETTPPDRKSHHPSPERQTGWRGPRKAVFSPALCSGKDQLKILELILETCLTVLVFAISPQKRYLKKCHPA